MSIDNEEDLHGLSQADKVVGLTLKEVKEHLRPGVTTSYLDEIALGVFRKFGAQSAPKLVYGIPATILISVNDEIVHGIPGDYEIKPGDLVKIDVTAELNGYMADAATTVAVPPVSAVGRKLCQCARSAFNKAMKVARSGRALSVIGKAVETEVRRHHLRIIPELFGHGIGRTIHEDPTVRNYYDPQDRQPLSNGLVITVEPMVTTGTGEIVEDSDGWAICTADGTLAAHYEHTIIITDHAPIVLTAA